MYSIQYLVRKHLPAIDSLERFTTRKWDIDKYISYMRKSKIIGICLFHSNDFKNENPVAICVYKLYKDYLTIGHLVYNPEFDNVLLSIVEGLTYKCEIAGRSRLDILIPERDLHILRDLKDIGVPAVGVVDDKILFQLTLEKVGQ